MDKPTANYMELFNFLKEIPFFASLDKSALWPLANICTTKSYSEGELIIKEDANPLGIFIIKSGRVAVFKQGKHEDSISIAELEKGDILGEISVIDNLPATSSVKALEPVSCIFISQWDFTIQMQAYPEIALQLLQVFAERIRVLFDKLEHSK